MMPPPMRTMSGAGEDMGESRVIPPQCGRHDNDNARNPTSMSGGLSGPRDEDRKSESRGLYRRAWNPGLRSGGRWREGGA